MLKRLRVKVDGSLVRAANGLRRCVELHLDEDKVTDKVTEHVKVKVKVKVKVVMM